MSCSLQPQTFFIMMGLLAFLWVLIAIVVRSIRRPDHDNYFDEPENWGDR